MVEVSETIQLPDGYKLNYPGHLQKIDGNAASVTGDIRQNGNTILIAKTIKLKKRVYEPGEWQNIRNCVLEFKKPDGGILVIKSTK
jgi:hypothetical protein